MSDTCGFKKDAMRIKEKICDIIENETFPAAISACVAVAAGMARIDNVPREDFMEFCARSFDNFEKEQP